MAFHRLDLVYHGIECFEGLSDLADRNFVTVNVQGNSLSDFDGFGTHMYMAQLDVRGNGITSFYGLTRQRSLQTMWLKGNPIATHPFYRIMALMVVGFSLVDIDGSAVTPEERTLARKAGSDAAMAVSFGWLLDMKPRTPGAFQGILSECRRVHERKHARGAAGGGARRKTIMDALREVEAAADPPTHSAAGKAETLTETQRSLQTKAQGEDEEADTRRTVERLSKRVATLEHMLREASAESVAANTASLLLSHASQERPFLDPVCRSAREVAVVSRQGEATLTEHDLRSASAVLFTSGIATRTNHQSSCNHAPRRSCLQLTRHSVAVLNYTTRSPTFELKLSGSVTVTYRRPKRLLLENRFGVSLEITFEDHNVLRTVFKLLFLLRSKPLPPLPSHYAENDEEQTERGREGEMETASSSSSTVVSAALTPASSRQGHVSKWSSSRPAVPKASNTASAASRTSHRPQALIAAGTKHRDREDNISDIPPLPRAGGGSSLGFHADFHPSHDDTPASTPEKPRKTDDNAGAEASATSLPTASVAPPSDLPAVPARLPQEQPAAASEHEGDSDAVAPAAVPPRVPPPRTPSPPSSVTRPAIPPRRSGSSTDLHPSDGSAPSAPPPRPPPPVKRSVNAPPLVPPRRAAAAAAALSSSSRASAASHGGAANPNASSPREHSVAASLRSVPANGAAAAEVESVKSAKSADGRPASVAPVTSVPNTALESAVAGGHVGESKEPSTPVRLTTGAPAPPSGRFAHLMVDSDSDSDA